MPLGSSSVFTAEDELKRLAALRSYHLDGPAPEAAFDHIVRLAADLFDVPIALVSFVEAQHLLLKGRVGIDADRAPRDASFCAATVMGRDVVVVPDAREDHRFAANPLVTGDPFIRFYAGAPIVTPLGYRIGSVCIIHTEPRPPLTAREREMLESLARIAIDGLELRRLDTLRRAAMRMTAATPDAIVCFDDDGTVTFWNAAAERMFGYGRSEMMGQPVARLVSSEDSAAFRDWVDRLTLATEQAPADRTITLGGRHADGSRVPVEISVATWRDGERRNLGAIVRDLSERVSVQERLRHLTHFDGLTDLPNRSQFLEQVDAALRRTRPFAVLKVGLDRFKAVNGAMGLSAGDGVLVAAARRVTAVAGEATLVARLGADEFGILLTTGDDLPSATALAHRVMDRLGEPFQVGASICHLGASVGVMAVSDVSAGGTADHVLKCALLALQQAKLAGGRRCEVFRPELGRWADERRRLEEELVGAAHRGEFELYFQPQVSLPEAALIGAEALLRWRHPGRGLLAPGAFLAVLETSAAAVAVGRWIIHETCAFAARMGAAGAPLRVGLNLFAAQLRDAALLDDIAAALATTGLPARLLELELTETTVLGLDDSVIETLARIRNLGVNIAFDDYGTGYASLSLLKRYPLTRLKIDREFVRDLQTDPDDAAIVKAVIALGASFGLDVIAEGIETPQQAASLVALGCREAQGYLFGKPVPASDFMARHAGRVTAFEPR